MIRIILTSHARDRMAERNVTEDDIRSVLENPSMSLPGRPSGTCYIGNGVNGASLQVCIVGVLTSGKAAKIKSAYWREGS